MPTDREMTLDEWCARLPDFHLVNRELRDLKARVAELQAQVDRANALPDKWRRNADGSHIHEGYPATNEKCAAELEAAINGDQ